MTRWTSLIAAGLVAALAPTTALAFDQKQYDSVKKHGEACFWCDLSGAPLADADLRDVELPGTDLTDADLSGAVLRNADLSGADLTRANLAGTDLSGADLTGADLNQVDMSAAILSGAKLDGAYCDWATQFPEDSGLSCDGVTLAHK